MQPQPLHGNPSTLDRRDLFVLGGMLLFLVLFFGGVLLEPSGHCLGRPDGDARNQFYGWRAYGFGQIREGRFPLWNPYEFLGMPFVASLQSAMFYPVNWLAVVLPLGRAVNLEILLNLFLSGTFTYFWTRRLGLRWAGAAVAAATYTFSAQQVLRIYEGHWSFLAPMAWIPAVLLFIEVMLSGGAWPLAVIGGAAAVAMQWFGGNPQYAFYGGIAATLYLAGRLIMLRGRPPRGMPRVLGGFALMYSLGTVLAGAQVLPALEMLSMSARMDKLSYAWISQYDFVPESLLTFLAPDIYGSDVGVQFWGRWNLWETSAYIGVAAFVLALFAVARRRRGITWLAAALAAFFLLLALGRHTPLLRLFYEVVPGFGLFRAPARFLCEVSLFLALLAGIGAEALLREMEEPRARSRALPVIAGGALLMMLLGAAMLFDLAPVRNFWDRFMTGLLAIGPGERPYLQFQTVTPAFRLAALREAGGSFLRAGLIVGALAALFALARGRWQRRGWIVFALLAVVAVDVWSFGRRYLVTFDPARDGLTPGAVAFLREVKEPFRFARAGSFRFPTCEGMTWGFTCLEGTQPNVPARFRDVFWHFQGLRDTLHRTIYSIFRMAPPLRMLNLRFLVQYRDNPVTEMPGLRRVYEDERIRIEELPDPFPRAWLTHQYVVVPEAEKALELLTRLNYGRVTLFEEDPGLTLQPPAQPAPLPRFERYEANRATLRVTTPTAAILMLSDLHYPGWSAAVNGTPAPILRANYCMRAVALPAGEHLVEFTYAPPSFYYGLALSGAGIAAVLGLLGWHLRERRKVALKATERTE